MGKDEKETQSKFHRDQMNESHFRSTVTFFHRQISKANKSVPFRLDLKVDEKSDHWYN